MPLGVVGVRVVGVAVLAVAVLGVWKGRVVLWTAVGEGALTVVWEEGVWEVGV